MKRSAQKSRRQIFVLTPEEKRTVVFIVGALILGLGTKHYRQKHFVPPARPAVVETAQNAAISAEERAEAKRRKPARR